MPIVTLWGAGLMMLVVGALHLIAPQFMMDPAGIALTTTNHKHIVRAAYGGSYLGIAAIFLIGAIIPRYRVPSLGAVAILFSGFALGRLVSITADGVPAALYLSVLAFEVLFAVLAVMSLRSQGGDNRA
jgi:hypothetical protein